MRSNGKVIVHNNIPMEQPSFCDSMWACILNDYAEEEVMSVQTEPSEREEVVDHHVLRRQERQERRERRRSTSRSRRARSRSKTREKRGGSSHRRRVSTSSSDSDKSYQKSRRESRVDEDEDDYRREMKKEEEPVNMMDEGRDEEERDEGEREIPSAPSVELRKASDPDAERRANNGPETPAPSPKKERMRPPRLSIGDDSPRENAPAKREEAPPVLFRSIKGRYNPAVSPRVMSPMSSPRSPSHLRVDSEEFNTMEDYQKKILESRSKRAGGRFERIQAIRSKSSMNKVDP